MAAHECAQEPGRCRESRPPHQTRGGERLLAAIVDGPHRVHITADEYDVSWQLVSGGRTDLAVPELLAAVAALRDRPFPQQDQDWLFVLSDGERRAFTGNTIMRYPAGAAVTRTAACA